MGATTHDCWKDRRREVPGGDGVVEVTVETRLGGPRAGPRLTLAFALAKPRSLLIGTAALRSCCHSIVASQPGSRRGPWDVRTGRASDGGGRSNGWKMTNMRRELLWLSGTWRVEGHALGCVSQPAHEWSWPCRGSTWWNGRQMLESRSISQAAAQPVQFAGRHLQCLGEGRWLPHPTTAPVVWQWLGVGTFHFCNK